MSIFHAFILSIIQGLCEFLPISSSAHFKLAKYFLNIDSSILFELTCNLGTTLAALVFLRREIYKIFFIERKKIIHISLAILPLIPIYLLYCYIKSFTSKIEFLGLFFIFTALTLFLAIKKNTSSNNKKISDMLFIGIMQSLALIPGISRSGFTISAACIRGWQIKEAITFSFLLAIPTVIGGNILEAYKYFSKTPSFTINTNYIIGFIVSFIVGMLSIKYIFNIITKKKLVGFAVYCLILGIVTLTYFNL